MEKTRGTWANASGARCWVSHIVSLLLSQMLSHMVSPLLSRRTQGTGPLRHGGLVPGPVGHREATGLSRSSRAFSPRGAGPRPGTRTCSAVRRRALGGGRSGVRGRTGRTASLAA